VVVPIYNERENAALLHRSLREALKTLRRKTEIVFVDDGSTDGTREVLRELAAGDKSLRVVLFRRNFGQSAAMAAGFRASRGDIVVTMDGDLQNDPADIPQLLSKIEEGYDVVSGWRKDRRQAVPPKILQAANRLICSAPTPPHDTVFAWRTGARPPTASASTGNCTGFAALARVEGARIRDGRTASSEAFRKSKYNLTHFRVLLDLSTLNLFLKYLRNPFRFFGKIGVGFFFTGLAVCAWIAHRMIVRGIPASEVNVAVTLVFLCFVAGFQWLSLGAVASLIVKTGRRRGASLSGLIRQDAS
jgi:hypothetical protein